MVGRRLEWRRAVELGLFDDAAGCGIQWTIAHGRSDDRRPVLERAWQWIFIDGAFD
jgi:hypothetical protein